MLQTDHMQANKEDDPKHIDYIIPGDDSEKKGSTLSLLLGNAVCEE